ncbi:choice-of-anchor B family protein [Flavobacteriales bacterium]|nr:choice-of-anchor B family protein [Flavobacteriales bacterium]
MTKFNTLLSSIASAWLLLGLANPGLAQSPCVNGSANYNGTNYPCSNVDLLSAMGVNQVGSGEMNDIWGWTDPLDGKEYVILGRTNGTAFIDISDPLNPVYLANVNTETSSSLWRDIKVYNNHAFIVSEAGGHGMQVFDLTRLRNITNPPVTLLRDAWYSGFGNAHNIVINEESGRAYGVGTNTASGGLHIMDISNPLNPTLLGFFSEDGYTHDAQVVNYIGPDGQYSGKEIAFACNENTVTIVDVTDPSDATMIAAEGYNTSAYTHQGWLTEDHRYFVVGDELDEQSSGTNTRTYFFNVEDLNNPFLEYTYVGSNAAIDHNLYIKDGIAYQSNYRAGLRLLDVNNPTNPQEVGFIDIYPSSNSAAFNGTWSNYPYFASGVVAVSHIEEGLFLVQPNLPEPCTELCGCTDATACNYDASAVNDDNSCDFSCYGCTNSTACNYDAGATLDDGSCILNGVDVVVTILTDNYPAETTWTVTDDGGATVMSGGPYSTSGTTYTESACLGEGCYTLTVNDSYGDGICCAFGIGSYTVSVDGTNVVTGGEFNSTVSEEFCVESSEVQGCTEVFACNYDPAATVDNGSCTSPFDIVYEDFDGDGIGGDLAIADVCELGPGISLETGDCDDTDASVYPGAPGTSEGVDNNCDGVVSGDELIPCPADVNSDGQITVADVLLLLSDFGCAMDCGGDVDGDDAVTVADILLVLAAFGQPC